MTAHLRPAIEMIGPGNGMREYDYPGESPRRNFDSRVEISIRGSKIRLRGSVPARSIAGSASDANSALSAGFS